MCQVYKKQNKTGLQLTSLINLLISCLVAHKMMENVDHHPPHVSCFVHQLKHMQFTVIDE